MLVVSMFLVIGGVCFGFGYFFGSEQERQKRERFQKKQENEFK